MILKFKRLLRLWNLFLAVVIATSIAGCAGTSSEKRELRQWPFLKKGKGLILTEIPGTQKNEFFLLDSGNSITQVDPGFFHQHESEFSEVKTRIEGAAQQPGEKLYRWTFDYGLPEVPPATTRVTSLEKYRSEVDGFNCCTGILGLDFFKRYAIEVNQERARLYFKNSYKDLPGSDWYQVPISFSEQKQVIQLNCSSNLGPNLSLDLDTGLEFPLLLSEKFVSENHIRKKLARKIITLKRDAFYVGLGELKCGDYTTSFPVRGLVLKESLQRSSREADGRIGVALLGQNYVIDLPAGKLWIRKNSVASVGEIGSGQVFQLQFDKKVQTTKKKKGRKP